MFDYDFWLSEMLTLDYYFFWRLGGGGGVFLLPIKGGGIWLWTFPVWA